MREAGEEAGYFLSLPLFLPLVYDNISEFQGSSPTFLKEAALFVLKEHKEQTEASRFL